MNEMASKRNTIRQRSARSRIAGMNWKSITSRQTWKVVTKKS
jgi:hypothetical protein